MTAQKITDKELNAAIKFYKKYVESLCNLGLLRSKLASQRMISRMTITLLALEELKELRNSIKKAEADNK